MAHEPFPVSGLDFDYPEALVASEPAEPRDSSRLLVLDRAPGRVEHRVFRELPETLAPGDCLVLNETKVFFCRLSGRKSTGGKAALLLTRELAPGLWAALSLGLKAGMTLSFPEGLAARVEGLTDEGEYACRFTPDDVASYLEAHGQAPLPPYILKRKKTKGDDRRRYQTVYAKDQGSIAAPTAGLHFTDAVLAALAARGVQCARLTLHVGRGTFNPIKTDDARAHRMLPERYRLDAQNARAIRAAADAGRRVVAVGTTSTRTLETLAARPEGLAAAEGWTDLYITPGHRFRVVTGLLTNFHLPRSTPLVLAAAFAGQERLLAAYREAVARGYRLFSYGDSMLIL